MKNQWESRHLLFGVHRGYGIQNDRLDLTINEFLSVWRTMHRGPRYFQFFGFFRLTFLWISFARVQRFQNRQKLVNREIETVVLNTINPMIFPFSLIGFSKKIYENLFYKRVMPLGYMKVGMWSKKPKAIFFREILYASELARLQWSHCTWYLLLYIPVTWYLLFAT